MRVNNLAKYVFVGFYVLNFLLFLFGGPTAPLYFPLVLEIDFANTLYERSNNSLRAIIFVAEVLPILIIYVYDTILLLSNKLSGFALFDIVGILIFVLELVLILSGCSPNFDIEFPELWNPVALMVVDCTFIVPFILRLLARKNLKNVS